MNIVWPALFSTRFPLFFDAGTHPDRLNYELSKHCAPNDRVKRPKVLFSFSNLPTNQISCDVVSTLAFIVLMAGTKTKTSSLSHGSSICAINRIEL